VLSATHTHQRLKHLAMGVAIVNAIPATTQTALNDTQIEQVVGFLVAQAKLTIRQEAELASLEAKKRPRTPRNRNRRG